MIPVGAIVDAAAGRPTARFYAAVGARRTPLVPFRHTDELSVVTARLRTALSVLPADADLVAERFTEWGLRGDTCNSGACPLSRYLTARCGHEVFASVNEVEASGGGWSFTTSLPSHLREFVAGFDGGEWPALIDNGGDDA